MEIHGHQRSGRTRLSEKKRDGHPCHEPHLCAFFTNKVLHLPLEDKLAKEQRLRAQVPKQSVDLDDIK